MNLPRVLNVLGLEIPDVADHELRLSSTMLQINSSPPSLPAKLNSRQQQLRGLNHPQLDISSHRHDQDMRISRDPKTLPSPQIPLITNFLFLTNSSHPQASHPTNSDSSELPKTQKSLRVTSVKVRRATNYSAEELFITCSSILLSAQA
jgi:hypothetical protein